MGFVDCFCIRAMVVSNSCLTDWFAGSSWSALSRSIQVSQEHSVKETQSYLSVHRSNFLELFAPVHVGTTP